MKSLMRSVNKIRCVFIDKMDLKDRRFVLLNKFPKEDCNDYRSPNTIEYNAQWPLLLRKLTRDLVPILIVPLIVRSSTAHQSIRHNSRCFYNRPKFLLVKTLVWESDQYEQMPDLKIDCEINTF